jgi:hypothetical protein
MAKFDLDSYFNTVLPTISTMYRAEKCIQVADGLSLPLFSDFESVYYTDLLEQCPSKYSTRTIAILFKPDMFRLGRP